MDMKMTSPCAAAVKKKRSKPLALTDAVQKAKLDRFVREMAKFEKEQGRRRSDCCDCRLRLTSFLQRQKPVLAP